MKTKDVKIKDGRHASPLGRSNGSYVFKSYVLNLRITWMHQK